MKLNTYVGVVVIDNKLKSRRHVDLIEKKRLLYLWLVSLGDCMTL